MIASGRAIGLAAKLALVFAMIGIAAAAFFLSQQRRDLRGAIFIDRRPSSLPGSGA